MTQTPALQPPSIGSTLTQGRICNMIAETSKRKNDIEGAIKFYLKGMAYEPSYLENFLDLAHLSQVNEPQLCNILLILVKIIQQV